MSEEDNKTMLNEETRRRQMQLAGLDEEVIDYRIEQEKERLQESQEQSGSDEADEDQEALNEGEAKQWKSGSDCHNTSVERDMPEQLYEEMEELDDEAPMDDEMGDMGDMEPVDGPEGGEMGDDVATELAVAIGDAIESVTGVSVDVEGGDMGMEEPMDEPMDEPEMDDEPMDEPEMGGEEPMEEPEMDMDDEEEVEIDEDAIEEAVQMSIDKIFSSSE